LRIPQPFSFAQITGDFVAIDTQSKLCNNSAHVSSEPPNGQDSGDEPANISGASRKRGAAPVVYLAYSDESGTGDERQEPFVLVAALVIHPDSQWEKVSAEIERLVSEHVPLDKQATFEFHAHDLFGQLHRPSHKALLEGICRIPFKFHVPIYTGLVHRDGMRILINHDRSEPVGKKELLRLAQGMAFYLCAQRVETAFCSFIPTERVLWIADRTDANVAMKELLKLGQLKAVMPDFPTTKLDHVIDTIYFGDSRESRALQLADVCNYVIRRHLVGKANAAHYYRLIESQLTLSPILFAPSFVA
jgi:hypothetical protein